MNPILPESEATEFESRYYVNPQVGIDENNRFIDNLRQTQQNNLTEISEQTQNLGTDVPTSMGGLTGASSYWNSRYVTPQTNSAYANLRATAQATALNEALKNEEAKWKKRYNDAYRAYQKRAWNKSNSSGGGGAGNEGDDPDFIPTGNAITSAENEIALPEDTNSGFTGAYAQSNPISGGGVPANTEGNSYVLVDRDGNMTGIRIYSSNQTVTGVETPSMSYSGDTNNGLFGGIQYGGGSNMIKNTIASGGKLLDAAGNDITTGWYWRVTH